MSLNPKKNFGQRLREQSARCWEKKKPLSLPGAHKTRASCASRAFKKLGLLWFLQRADEKRHNIATCGLLKAAGSLLDWRTAKKKAKTMLQRRRANVKSSKRM
jgi:hypothetical protein